MNIEKQLRESLSQALTYLYNISLDTNELLLQPTRKEFLGTHTFVTFPIAKRAKKNPQEVAEDLGKYLQSNSDIISNYQVVKGFLNLILEDKVWLDKLTTITRVTQWGQGS